MAVLYWSIPLFVVAVAMAVLPVLYAMLKEQHWQDRQADLVVVQEVFDAREPGAIGATADAGHVLERARGEVVALLERLEQLRELVAGEELSAGA
jgi:hypothetical protein